MRTIANIKLHFSFALLIFAGMAHAGNILYADHPLAGKIWDMNSRSFIDEATLLARIDKANVLLLGETHDNPQHHNIQQKLLKARIDSGARPALLMEQLDRESQPALDLALAGSNHDEALNAATGLIKFTDWKFYRPFLATAIDNKLPVIAANISSRQLQPVIWNGFAAYDAAALKRMAVEEVWSESRQNYMLSHIGGAHCGQIRDSLREGLTRSQRLRDAMMADSAVSSIGRGIVAIVGSSHARRDVGMPLYLGARDPSARIFSIGFVEVIPGRNAPETYETESASGDAPYDAIWFTPRVERADPCADPGKK
ncbi:MAG: ChaN family lipoprotein [Gallionella sp.]